MSLSQPSNHSAARSRSTAGAKGRNGSRFLITRFSRSRMSASCGAARMERCPSARGPHSKRPRATATTLPWAINPAAVSSGSAGVVCARPSRSASDMAASLDRGRPRAAVVIGPGRLPSSSIEPSMAAPRAPPASPAAGCTKTLENPLSRRTLELATQLSATPPARHRFSLPVSSRACLARPRIASSVAHCRLAAMSA